MSFSRDTAKTAAQQAIYDLVKTALGVLWLSFAFPALKTVGQSALGMTPGQAFAWGLLFALVLPFIALFLWDWRKNSRPNREPAEPIVVTTPRSITVFAHREAARNNPETVAVIEAMFSHLGWQVESAGTELERHRDGVWVLGGPMEERGLVAQALNSIGIEARVDNADQQPNLHVAVGNAKMLTAGNEPLSRLAAEDERQIDHRLYHINRESECEPHLDAPEPFIDLRFPVINYSVFPLKFMKIDGRIQYRGNPLSRDLEVLSGDLPRGLGKLIFRQWLTREVAEYMKTHAPATIGTGNFGVLWNYENAGGELKTVRMSFPGDMFSIGEATPQEAVNPPELTQSPGPPPLYVGRIEPAMDHVLSERWFDLTFTLFNGTGCELVIDQILRGFLRVDEQLLKIPPSMPQAPSPSGREIQFTVRQFLPEGLAQAIGTKVNDGTATAVMFSDLRIVGTIKHHSREPEQIDIPIPDGVNIVRRIACGLAIVFRVGGGAVNISGGVN